MPTDVSSSLPAASLKWVSAGSIETLREEKFLVTGVKSRPVLLLLDGDKVSAVDNRCPHMGFPLSKGTLNNGVLTCPWHHARFDAESGCTFDLFADDVPTYDVKVEGGQIFVADQPRNPPGADYYRSRLEVGLAQNIEIIICKSIIGLLDSGISVTDIITQIVRFGSRGHEAWDTGMTCLAIAANVAPRLSRESQIYLLCFAARQLAGNCQGRPARRDRYALVGNESELGRLKMWLQDWLLVRHRDGTERTILTAASRFSIPELNDLLFECSQNRIFADVGHPLDFTNKLFELTAQIDEGLLVEILPLLVPGMVNSRGAQETSAWRLPIDLIALIQEAETEVRTLDLSHRTTALPNPELPAVLLGEDPKETCRLLVEELRRGIDPLVLAREITHAASMRLARFPESNDLGDWFSPVHVFIFANAVTQGIRRQEESTFGVVRGLFVAAMAIYVDRFLNIPAAPLPDERPDFEKLSTEPEALLESFLTALDSGGETLLAPSFVARYVSLQHDEERLVDRLIFAVLREDLDFHKLQAIEAAIQQAALWPKGSKEREHLYTGAARHLAAHCPTRRNSSRVTRIAIRLQSGEIIHEK